MAVMSEDMFQVSRILSAFLTYVLVLIRCGCLVMFAPFLSSEVFSTHVRLAFVMVFPLLLLPAASRTAMVPEHLEMIDLAMLAGQEFTLGLAIAFLATLVFVGVQIAGQLAGQQIGFSMASVMDPQSGMDMPILSFLNMNLTLMMFIVSKLHLMVVYIMFKSYDYVAIGTLMPDVNFNNPVVETGLDQLTLMMNLGVRMSMPIMMIMMMNSVVEGFITKTMPQMNIQVLGMPLRIVVGLCALIFVYPAMCMALIPADYQFNLLDPPEGELGDMLLGLSEMVVKMGLGSAYQ